jgi:hypothetical protein
MERARQFTYTHQQCGVRGVGRVVRGGNLWNKGEGVLAKKEEAESRTSKKEMDRSHAQVEGRGRGGRTWVERVVHWQKFS